MNKTIISILVSNEINKEKRFRLFDVKLTQSSSDFFVLPQCGDPYGKALGAP